jgi:hypothetical protein
MVVGVVPLVVLAILSPLPAVLGIGPPFQVVVALFLLLRKDMSAISVIGVLMEITW